MVRDQHMFYRSRRTAKVCNFSHFLSLFVLFFFRYFVLCIVFCIIKYSTCIFFFFCSQQILLQVILMKQRYTSFFLPFPIFLSLSLTFLIIFFLFSSLYPHFSISLPLSPSPLSSYFSPSHSLSSLSLSLFLSLFLSFSLFFSLSFFLSLLLAHLFSFYVTISHS